MQMWFYWWDIIVQLRPACSRLRTFMWFAVCVAGLTIRSDLLGVTSIIRALGLNESYYDNLLDNFHSNGIKLNLMTRLWTTIVIEVFPGIVRFNDRLVLVGDGVKVAKQGKKMPAVKLLHQQSESNTKAEYIMGHSFQAVSLLIKVGHSVFAVPLSARVHEGVVLSNRLKKTLLDKMIDLLMIIAVDQPYYFVADAYYATGKIIKGLLKNNNQLISRVRSNAVAFQPAKPSRTRKAGRPKQYGKKISLKSLFLEPDHWLEIDSPVYGEKDVTIQYHVVDLLWRPAGRLVRFVAVKHPTRGQCLLMSTDLSLAPIDIIQMYGLRFKIELAFKQAIHVIGTFSYHFWMLTMKPLRRRQGNQYLHRETQQYRQCVMRKLHAYHVFVMAGVVAQGLLHYLAACHTQLVWRSFGSWLRTVRPGIAPSELVVSIALRHTFPEFLLGGNKTHNFAKFIAQRQDLERAGVLRLAS